MRPLQELPTSAVPASAAPGSAGAARPDGRDRPAGSGPLPRRLRCVIGVIGGALWWGGLLWLLLGPQPPAASWQGWVAAGGWGLGLIPLHAVPVRPRPAARRRARHRTPGADLAV